MPNLPPTTAPVALTSYSPNAHSKRTHAFNRRPSLNVGADHIAVEYFGVDRVEARRTELRTQGYSVSGAAFVTCLEGRENTLLDRTDAGLTSAENDELRALQALLWEMHADTKTARLEADVEAPRPPSERLAGIRRVDMNVPLRERLRRLLNARCASLQALTGEDHDDTRHLAVFDATNGRTDSSMDRRVTDDEMGAAVGFAEDLLHAAGFDFAAEDAAYFARRHVRELGALRPALQLAA